MNDNSYTFSFDFQVPATTATQPDLIAFEDCSEHPLPDDNVLIRSKRTGKKTIVTSEVLYSLRFCDKFRTLEDQVTIVADRIPELADHRDELRHILSSVLDAGLMVSAKAFSASIHTDPVPSDRDSGPTLCILTCDRPEALSRLLESIGKNKALNTDQLWYVIDDSRISEKQQRNRSIIDAFNQKQNAHITYFGPDAQRKFQTQLTDLLPEHEQQIAFLIGRHANAGIASYGRSRNLALLLSVNNHLICMDDDILYEKLAPPIESTVPGISSKPREAVFYDTPLEWLQDNAKPENPSKEMNRFLGKSLGQAFYSLSHHQPAAENICDLLPVELDRIKPDSKILVTACGSFGDPGSNNNDWVFSLETGSRNKLSSSKEHYELGITQRNLWCGRKSHHFVTGFALLSQMTGLDNQSLLPPYFPLFRNEDLLFGEALQFIHPDALLMEFPWSVAHLPLDARKWDKMQLDKAASHDFSGLTSYHLTSNNTSFHSNDPVSRMNTLGRQLLDLSTANDTELLDLIEEQTLRMRSAKTQYFSRLLEETEGTPDYWQNDVKRIIAANQSGLLEPAEAIFDSLGDSDSGNSLDLARNYWRSFGLAMQAWPELRAAAEQISEASGKLMD